MSTPFIRVRRFLRALPAVAAATAVMPAAASATTFSPDPAVLTPVAGTPRFVALADVTGDGRPDEIVVGTDLLIRVRTSSPTGLSTTTVDSSGLVGGTVRDIVTTDADRDGKVDLLVAQDSQVMLFKGDGAGHFLIDNGTFAGAPVAAVTAPVIGLGSYPDRVDLDTAGTLRVTLNTYGVPDGPPITTSVLPGGATALVSGDFDDDGGVEHLAGGTSGAVIAETMGSPVTALTTDPITALVKADLNEDGIDDAIALSGTKLIVWRGAAGGPRKVADVTLPGAAAPATLAVGQLDGLASANRRPDVVVADAGKVFVLRTGADGVPALSATLTTDAPAAAGDVAIADLDGDGAGDVVTTDGAGGRIVDLFSGVRLTYPSPFGLGDQVAGTTSAAQALTVRNDGWAPALFGVTAGGLPIGSPYAIDTTNCSGSPLLPGLSCTDLVRFSPAGAGAVNQSLNLTWQRLFFGPRSVPVSLTGTGTTPPVGPTGPAGPAGPQGAAGNDGTNGTPGATGAQGAAGTNGTNGTDGTNGAPGAVGSQGATGAAGAQGSTGAKGDKGATGKQGPPGIATLVTCRGAGRTQRCTVRVRNARSFRLVRAGKTRYRGAKVRGVTGLVVRNVTPGSYRIVSRNQANRPVVQTARIGSTRPHFTG